MIDIKFFEDRNKIRNYLHFDRKKSNQKVFEYVTNPANIAKHSFFPTISYFLNEKKIARNNSQKTYRKKRIKKNVNFNNKPRLVKARDKSPYVVKKYINQLKMRKSVLTRNDFKEKPRLINFPSHIDGNIYAYYSKIIGEKYEVFLKNERLDENIIAFRKVLKEDKNKKMISMCNIHFAKNVFNCIESRKIVMYCAQISQDFLII